MNITKVTTILTLDLTNFIGLLFVLSLYKQSFLKTDFYIYISIISMLILYFIGRALDSCNIIEIFHIIWASIMVIIPIFSYNTILISIHYFITLLTIYTRNLFNGCMVRVLEKERNYITNNILTNILNWDYIFFILGIVSVSKLYYLLSKSK